jgi:hypothetical protein
VRFLWPVNDLNLLVRDTVRITQRMISGGQPLTVKVVEPPTLPRE